MESIWMNKYFNERGFSGQLVEIKIISATQHIHEQYNDEVLIPIQEYEDDEYENNISESLKTIEVCEGVKLYINL